jgi:hypothetical protein
MINFNAILEIFYRPKKAFEKIAKDTKLIDGVIVWAVTTVLSLLAYGIVAKKAGINIIAVWFGFGLKITWASLFIGIARQLFIIFVMVMVCGLVAKKIFKATGSKKNLASMLGYANVLVVPKALASAVILSYIARVIAQVVSYTVASEGTTIPDGLLETLFSRLTFFSLWLNIIFFVWMIYLFARAMSAAYSMSLLKGIACAFFGWFVVQAVFFAVKYATGFSLTWM